MVKPKTSTTISPSSDQKTTWKIENVVATGVIHFSEKQMLENVRPLDLNNMARKYPDCEYNPERFPGLVMRIGEPKATCLLFSTGKVVLTGLRSSEEASPVMAFVIDKVKKSGATVEGEPEFTVQNIVASGDFHGTVDLNEATIVLENAMYEPEVFPGLIYRMADPKTVFLIFSTGRIVCTGGKTKESVGEAIEKMERIIRDAGLFGKAEGEDSAGDEIY